MGDVNAGSQNGQDPIAIIGMACRLPGDSNSPQKLWNLLERGDCAVPGVPDSRFGLEGHFDGSRKPNTLKSPGAMFLENIDLSKFDSHFFGISRQEAIAMDPQQRQLLEVVYECLENAGVTLEALNDTPVGCFVASSTSGRFILSTLEGSYTLRLMDRQTTEMYTQGILKTGQPMPQLALFQPF
ncbi:MAG: hypothetical protein Q9227_000786 [Pyrenula ochraceoflavens]